MREGTEITALGVGTNLVQVTTPTGDFFLAELDEFGKIEPLNHDFTCEEMSLSAQKLNSEGIE